MNTRAITGGANVEHGEVLACFVAAIQAGSRDEQAEAREAARRALGDAGLVDACAVLAHFNMMTRMADGAGIPLDAGIALATHDLRRDMGIDEFPGAEDRPSVGFWRRLLGKAVAPLTPGILRIVSFLDNRGP